MRIVRQKGIGTAEHVGVQDEIGPARKRRPEENAPRTGSSDQVADDPMWRLDGTIKNHLSPVAMKILPEVVLIDGKSLAKIDNGRDLNPIADKQTRRQQELDLIGSGISRLQLKGQI